MRASCCGLLTERIRPTAQTTGLCASANRSKASGVVLHALPQRHYLGRSALFRSGAPHSCRASSHPLKGAPKRMPNSGLSSGKNDQADVIEEDAETPNVTIS
eukprot:1842828-Pyramimonas_sp.AAC.1